MQFSCPFVLASGSPRRKHLLQQIGFKFEIKVSDVDESFDPALRPGTIVEEIAARKARVVEAEHPDALILAADTIVVLDGEILGKPADETEAAAMLSSLSNKLHTVYTGIALVHSESGRSMTVHEKTCVRFAPLSAREIAGYVATGSPMDKAGAYGIQDDRGALFISRIEGDYYNVVGLPLHRLYVTLKEVFSDLFVD